MSEMMCFFSLKVLSEERKHLLVNIIRSLSIVIAIEEHCLFVSAPIRVKVFLTVHPADHLVINTMQEQCRCLLPVGAVRNWSDLGEVHAGLLRNLSREHGEEHLGQLWGNAHATSHFTDEKVKFGEGTIADESANGKRSF